MADDLTEARERRDEKAFQALSDPRSLFAIPFGAIKRGSDAANGSHSDPVALGPALPAVKRLFAEFGIEQLPATWGELMGALSYCKVLHSMCLPCQGDSDDDKLYFRCSVETVAETKPELVPSLEAYHARDYEALKAIHRERLTMAVMSAHFDEFVGWSKA